MSDVKDEKPNVEGGEEEKITIKVANQNGATVSFRVKSSTPLAKLFDAYAKKEGVAASSIKFMLDGAPISPQQTPRELGLGEGDQIDVMSSQVGGN